MSIGSKGKTKSAATISIGSNIECKTISPKNVKTIGIILNKKQALELSRNLAIVATSDDIKNENIMITGHDNHKVSVLGWKED